MSTSFDPSRDILVALYDAASAAVAMADAVPDLASKLEAQGKKLRRRGMDIIAGQIMAVALAARSVAGGGQWSRNDLLREIQIAQLMLLAASEVEVATR